MERQIYSFINSTLFIVGEGIHGKDQGGETRKTDNEAGGDYGADYDYGK